MKKLVYPLLRVAGNSEPTTQAAHQLIRGGEMKKVTVLIAIVLCLGFVTSAQALSTPVKISSTSLVSDLYIDINDTKKKLRSGEFDIIINYGLPNEFHTISYCVDPHQYFSNIKVYDSGEYHIVPVTGPPLSKAAYLMDNYAVANTGSLDAYTYDQEYRPCR